jgi:5-methyltetrahydrofolate--homocysteine methyltransferase
MELKDLSQAMMEGDSKKATNLTKEAVNQGLDALCIFQEALIPTMNVVGKKMQSGEYFIPEVLVSAEAMKAAQEVLKPMMSDVQSKNRLGKVVMGTVQGDLHDIGKNLVSTMFEGGGFDVVDIGIDVPVEKFVEAVKKEKPDILGLSALLSVTMLNMKAVITSLEKSGLRRNVRVIIGGATVSQDFADEIGADGYARDAGGAVELAKSLMKIGGTQNEKA